MGWCKYLDAVDLEDLVAFVQETGTLGDAAADDPTDHDRLAVVPHRRTLRVEIEKKNAGFIFEIPT